MNFLNKIKNICFLKISGIKSVIFIELYKSQFRLHYIKLKDRIYNLPDGAEDIETSIICSKNYLCNDIFNDLREEINDFLESNNISCNHCIVGTSEFRLKNVSISDEVEDINDWIEENYIKFLPPGSRLDDFNYSYERKKKNEEQDEVLNFAFTRKSYIEGIIECGNVIGLNILSIYPLGSAIDIFDCDSEEILFINILNEQIIFTYFNRQKEILHNELYFHNNLEIANQVKPPLLKQIKDTITEIIQSLPLQKDNNSLSIYYQSNNQEVTPIIKDLFNSDRVNKFRTKLESKTLLPVVTVKKLFYSYDNYFNLLNENYKKNKRDELEKEFIFRTVLLSGLFMIFMLLSTYLTESYITEKLQSGENDLLEIRSEREMMDKYKTENDFLKQNLSLLTGLKGDKIAYSNMLKEITEVVTNKSMLNELSSKMKDENVLQIDLKGNADTQSEVVEIMKRLESQGNFKNISLVYANRENNTKSGKKTKSNQKQFVNFYFQVDYYAN